MPDDCTSAVISEQSSQEDSSPYATIIVSSRKSFNDAIYYQTVAKSNNFTGVVDSQNVMELSQQQRLVLNAFDCSIDSSDTNMQHTNNEQTTAATCKRMNQSRSLITPFSTTNLQM